MKSKILHIVGVPLITFSLFVFESSDPEYYLSELIWSFLITIVLWQGNGLLIRSLDKYIPWRQKVGPRIFIQIGLTVLFTAWLTYFAVKYLYSGVYDVHFSSLVFRRNLFVFLIISLLYNALYTGKHFFQEWRKSIVTTEELKRQNLISQYETLKSQINPHFLFNSVNTMIGLIDENPEMAKEYGHKFAEIYRHILAKGKEELITLKEELEIVDIQKHLFQSRFAQGLQLNLDIPKSYFKKRLPPMTLQMLVENAVKHNKISVKEPLIISIQIKGDFLEIKNNIQRKNLKDKTTHMGIENIKMRFKYLTDCEVVIKKVQNTFTVILPLLDKKEK